MQPMSTTSVGEPTGAASTAACDTDGAAGLLRLAAVAQALDAEQVADEARGLAARVSEGRFYVACVGQFKRGKSTLINALIGEPVLPVGYIPVTAVPTVVRFGELREARVRTRDALWRSIPLSDLEQYVSEEHNPENAKAVAGLEVFVPSPLLAAGLCLVDTPGLGSVFTGNTATTHAFIPHIDAALVVVGADPPLAGEELKLVEAVARGVQHLILVLNKADRTTDAERAAAADFTRRLLQERLHRPVEPLFEVSATERLEGRGPQRDWHRLMEALELLARDSGQQLIRAACERGLHRLRERLLVLIHEERGALQRPLEESERRIAAMKETLAGAERSMRELSFLFAAEEHRLSELFAARQKAYVDAVLASADLELEAALASAPRGMGPSYRRCLMREAQEIARRHVLPWLRTEQAEAEKEYRRAAGRFVEIGNGFLKRLAEAGISDLARMPHALDPEAGFRARSEFSFHDLIEVAQPASPLRWLADAILGLAGAHRLIQMDARQFLHRLLQTNSTRAQSNTLQRVQESRRQGEAEIRKLLREISRMAEQALAVARTAHTAGTSAVRAALARLDDLELEIRDPGSVGRGLETAR
jgi:ribosome biogenesis GTPase A